MSWCDLNLTFALAFVTLSLRTFRPGYILEIIRCRNLKFGGGGGIKCAMSWCDLNLTFALAFVTLSLNI